MGAVGGVGRGGLVRAEWRACKSPRTQGINIIRFTARQVCYYSGDMGTVCGVRCLGAGLYMDKDRPGPFKSMCFCAFFCILSELISARLFCPSRPWALSLGANREGG